MTKQESTIVGESFTYEILWGCCQRQLAIANKDENGSLYFYLTAMSMGYFTYEAFLNHALHKVDPEVFSDERNYFSATPYYGTSGKLKKLCELAGLEFPKVSERPYQSVKTLQKLRDSVAHGKPFVFEESVKHRVGENPTTIPTGFERVVSKKNANRCIEDLRDFIRWLNSELVKVFGSEGLLIHPLSGLLGHSMAEFEWEP